ncbi:FkbM family methyltransferase [Roseivivax sp. GX 12232]|uniref:FkbM family methyltransferase n=1 Tax=Roseivivax sp. GX 12232 TaxID=2900547 RepID=UPI001E517991|nr:FkbM family methyltransferase [Roseivivax sp. GX 12232]MCE0504631.1 FkbM family methyltransferase [Roseivivax sp. GX 12232]
MAKDRIEDSTEAEIRRLAEILAPARLTEIVDIGANPTELPVYMPLVAAGAARVTGFEPQPSAFAELADRQGPHERYLPHAVGDGTEGTLNVCRSGGFTSLFTPDRRAQDYLNKPRWSRMTEVRERIGIETRRLDDIAEIERLDLLKIDIQGGELAVFENGRSRLARTLAVITEVAFMPLYEDQPLLHDQMRELTGQGFQLHSFLSSAGAQMREAAELPLKPRSLSPQLLDGDALFLRDPRDMQDFSEEELKHYALIAAGALRLPDLVARCLRALIGRGALPETAFAAYTEILQGAARR